MAAKPTKKTVAKPGAKAKPKAKSGNKDYMKPVGGTKQEGYKAPGSMLKGTGNSSGRYKVGESASQKLSLLQAYTGAGFAAKQKYLKTGINPAAMKATAGNPKPTASQMATAKKKAASKAKSKLMETQAQKKKNTKPAKGSTKGATVKNPKPSASPSTGRYKRNP
jgi:hypothetical protein